MLRRPFFLKFVLLFLSFRRFVVVVVVVVVVVTRLTFFFVNFNSLYERMHDVC